MEKMDRNGPLYVSSIEETEKSNSEIASMIANDNPLQKLLSRQSQAGAVNTELASEMYNALHEIEYWPLDQTTDGSLIINLETDRYSYELLRRAGRSDPAQVIKNKRRLDLQAYGRIPTTEDVQRGVRLVFEDPDYQPTKLEKARLKEWEQVIVNNFFFPPYTNEPNFGNFIGACYDDFFDVDDMTFETMRNQLHEPIGVRLVDPMIWRPVMKEGTWQNRIDFNRIDPRLDMDNRALSPMADYMVSKLNPQILPPDYIAYYKNIELGRATRQRISKYHYFTTSETKRGYRGFSIVEQSLGLISMIVNAMKMNASNFTNNRMPDSFVAFTKGGLAGNGIMELERLKKMFNAQMSGANNANRFPVINLKDGGDAKVVSMRQNSRDMEYHYWVTLLFTLLCQKAGMDPREASMGAHGDVVSHGAMFDKDTDGIKKESKDAGEKAFLTHLEDSINAPNKHGENRFRELTNMRVKLKFVGFGIEDRVKKAELIAKQLATTASMNEVRASQDKEPVTFMLGKYNVWDIPGYQNQVIANTVMGVVQQEQQQAALAQQPEPQQPIAKDTKEEPKKEDLTAADLALIEEYGRPEDYKIKEEGADEN
jgi:hypothetical protein